MKKKLAIIALLIMVSTAGLYVYSQNEAENDAPKKAVATEPVATAQTTRKLLASLDEQLIALQKKISEHSERLAGVFAKWKREGKIKQAEQWNQVSSGINTLLSEIKIIAQDFDRIEKLRRNKELFDMLKALNIESQKITPEQGDIRYIMQTASVYGKNIFNDKLLEKIASVVKIEAPKEKKTESFEPYDQDFDFESYGDFEGFDDNSFDFDSFDFDSSDFGTDFDDEFYF